MRRRLTAAQRRLRRAVDKLLRSDRRAKWPALARQAMNWEAIEREFTCPVHSTVLEFAQARRKHRELVEDAMKEKMPIVVMLDTGVLVNVSYGGIL